MTCLGGLHHTNGSRYIDLSSNAICSFVCLSVCLSVSSTLDVVMTNDTWRWSSLSVCLSVLVALDVVLTNSRVYVSTLHYVQQVW